MRPPEELDAVDWASLTHAYGPAEDVPELVRALYSAEAEEVDAALDELFGNVLHQGSVYPATVEAVPFLAHAAAHARHHRAMLLMLLADMGGDGSSSGRVERQVWSRVDAEVSALLPSLRDPDRSVRRAAVRLAAVAAPGRDEAVAELLARYREDEVPAVRADALTALAGTDPDPDAVAVREAEALAGGVPELRQAAALAAMERSGPPYQPRLIRLLGDSEGGPDPDPAQDDYPFPGLGTGRERIAGVLDADPEAALAVVGIWIEQGDAAGHAWYRLDRIACEWRDREQQVTALLTEALPHQTDPDGLALCLESAARWLPRVREPRPGLLDVALSLAADKHERTANAAQLVLARLADSRLLSATDAPSSEALTVLAARTGELEHARRALRDPAPRHILELLGSLTPERAEQLLPELKELLRRRCAPVAVVRRLGELRVGDGELTVLLAEASAGTDELLSVCAAVAAARLGGRLPDDTRSLLARRLDSGRQVHWYVDECGRLGELGRPLLPRIEELCHSSHDWTRMTAAEARWRISGDAERAMPVLAELAGASPVGLQALQVLAEIGVTPEELRPRLRHWAFSPSRLLGGVWPPPIPHEDDVLRETCLRLLRA